MKVERDTMPNAYEITHVPRTNRALVRLYENFEESTVTTDGVTTRKYSGDVYEVSAAASASLDTSVQENYSEWLAMAKQVEYDALADEIRDKRDALLAASDPRALEDYPQTAEARMAWLAYRQALRDVPEQEGFPFVAEWPEAPSE